MKKKLSKIFLAPLKKLINPLNNEKGQSLVILAFSFVGLLGFLGLALDLGLVYVERTQLKRTLDASVLSSVTELTNEEQAGLRAIQYLSLNGYDLERANIYMYGCVSDIHDIYNASGVPGSGGYPNQTINVEPQDGPPYPYHISGGTPDNPDDSAEIVDYIFVIDTHSAQGDHAEACPIVSDPSEEKLGNSNKILITGTVKVDMNFFKIPPFNREHVMVKDASAAQSIDNLDVVLVLDRSGSMEYDPICYGCWERDWVDAQDYIDSGQDPEDDEPRWSGFYRYRGNGSIYPLGVGGDADGPFTHPDRVRACTTDVYEANDDLPDPKSGGQRYQFDAAETVYQNPGSDYNYMIIEAELYSNNTSPPELEIMQQGKGYWAFQRGEGNYGDETMPYIPSQGTSIDDDNPNNGNNPGAHMAHHPSSTEIDGIVYGKHYNFSDANADDAPALEYDFRFYDKDNYSDLPDSWGTQGLQNIAIWARVHAGRGLNYLDPEGDPTRDDHIADNVFYWKLLSSPDEDTDFNSEDNEPNVEVALDEISGNEFEKNDDPNVPPVDTDSDGRAIYWRWIKLGEFPLHYFDSSNPKIYRLYIYAGSAGFSLDRIVLTNNTSDSGNNGDGIALGGARTADVTTASAYRAACDICNVVYGENVPAHGTPDIECTYVNNQNGIPFADIYPNGLGFYLRDNRLEPLFGEWEMPMRTTKEALKTFVTRLDPERDQAGFVSYSAYGTSKSELTCLRAASAQTGIECASGTAPIKFTEVLKDIEDTRAGGGTPTAVGLRVGLEVLGYIVNPTHSPPGFDTNCTGNENSSCTRGSSAQRIVVLMSDGEPNSTTGECNLGTAPAWTPSNQDYRCPLKYANDASQTGITIYAIALGYGSNFEYMQAIADYGNGQAFFSASGGDLDIIFNTILSNIYVRLVR